MTLEDGTDVLVSVLTRHGSRTSEDVRDVTAGLIRDGRLAVGTRLPTIRELTQQSGVSTRAIVSAWGSLRREGLIETNRRGGTVVVNSATAGPAWSDRDLLSGSPDHRLQPDLTDALIAGLRSSQLNHPGREYITDRLRDAVLADWPFDAASFVAAGGGSEGLLLAVEAAAPAGSLVAVEEPVIPGFLDTLTEVGYEVIGIASDDEGARPESLADALTRRPVAVVLQPEGAYSAFGALSASRVAELVEVFQAADHLPWIVEDDAVGPLAQWQAPSVGETFGDRTVRVRSYCKAYGLDIKTCVIGGSTELIDRVIRLRVHGIATNSRILQDALAHLVVDADTADGIAVARSRYQQRRDGLVTELVARGASARAGRNSLVVWLDVRDETGALIELARRGIHVGAGARSFVTPRSGGLLRIAVPQLPDDQAALAELAEAAVEAAGSVHREFLG
ncbi:aminotransferase class I/II-fold pyridoxal phosphate-dependent enzyme [Gordonia soli]|uniref:Putative GntR family transcriptional regulator n=1 Tax=Gordonia soli NBRC 108243 TaxID=1223545 RepID=M0QGY2_9ACTN|nr:aminotransferase class I/II-fold pyridoxal phosphate-dependent enzyme [Gordonia soli]GAC67865.1 putative GntR family transcriptional regulator [Gordonia soli NBRC 108243]